MASDGSALKKAPVDLNTYQIERKALEIIPVAVARKYNVIPLAISGDTLLVGMAETDVLAFQELASIAKMRIAPVLADPEQIRQYIDSNYRAYAEIQKQFKDVPAYAQTAAATVPVEDIVNAPVVRALDLIMSEAVKMRASDIHLEPQADRLRVRYRIDGMLHDTMSLPMAAHALLVSRIKVMGNMNIADHKPQDGQLTVRVQDKDVDVRVATLNTLYGEMCSLRILDKSFASRALPDLGFAVTMLRQYQSMLQSPLGMILVSGPTGSGKTTTLYASINTLDRKGRKIVTVEDPVEYRFDGIDQIQVSPKAGLTFASGLRSIMRHDPDVIMVGEIRDGDTAAIATQSALTGQLVLSSIHANDTVGTLFRLRDLGIGQYLISATLIGVVSQRMVRRVCPHCRRLTKAPIDAEMAYASEMGEGRKEFYYGRGCNACANTGYLGRVAIAEIMVVDHELRSAMLSGANADELRQVARKQGMVSMWRDGMTKAGEGITTPSEVVRNILFTG